LPQLSALMHPVGEAPTPVRVGQISRTP
jgi:hypothetical protein